MITCRCLHKAHIPAGGKFYEMIYARGLSVLARGKNGEFADARLVS
jgi:hypothetical protein